jgi:Mn-dependent DtxR family transcriptional regulator
MSQQEVIKYLEEHPGQKYSASQLARELKVSYGSVSVATQKLRRYKFVKYESAVVNGKSGFVYWVDKK